jgi:hypothetical protein
LPAHDVTDPAPATESVPTPAAAPAAPAPAAEPSRAKVILHIGEPKTGTTFLQHVMWRNRSELAAQGVALPGHHPQDHYRATQDLRGIEKRPDDPAASWTGEWEILAGQARQAHRVSVISHELFSAVDAEQADRAVRSLLPAEVHVVLTVRDLATLLPAEWQESVKHRNTRSWEDWLGDVIDRESTDPDRRQFWFWRVHDTLEILRIWARLLPPEQIHVLPLPPRGSSNDVLWERFATLLEVDPASVDLTRARANTSLGLPEIAFLRDLNEAMSPEVPDWFYMWNVKETLAHRALAARPRSTRLVLPADREAWALTSAQDVATALRESKYDIIGNVDDLLPAPSAEPPASPSDQPAEVVLDVAVEAAAALVLHQYRKAYPAARPERGPGTRGLVRRVESSVKSSETVKRTVRELSSRFPAVRKGRVLLWQAVERRRERESR